MLDQLDRDAPAQLDTDTLIQMRNEVQENMEMFDMKRRLSEVRHEKKMAQLNIEYLERKKAIYQSSLDAGTIASQTAVRHEPVTSAAGSVDGSGGYPNGQATPAVSSSQDPWQAAAGGNTHSNTMRLLLRGGPDGWFTTPKAAAN